MSLSERVKSLAQRTGDLFAWLMPTDQGIQLDPLTGFTVIEQKTTREGNRVTVEAMFSGTFSAGAETYPAAVRAGLRPARYVAGAAVVHSDTNQLVGNASSYCFTNGTVAVAVGTRAGTRARVSLTYYLP